MAQLGLSGLSAPLALWLQYYLLGLSGLSGQLSQFDLEAPPHQLLLLGLLILVGL